MMRLTARATMSPQGEPLTTEVWRVVGTNESARGHPVARLVDSQGPSGRRLRLETAGLAAAAGELPTIHVPPELDHIAAGDVISVTSDGGRIRVLWKSNARHNSLLLTEQCDNLCLMCSQPPKVNGDSWLFERAKKVIDLLPDSAAELGLTGGEPTLNEDALIDLLDHCGRVRPSLSLHLLSNGRRFARPVFASRFSRVRLQDIMVGIPLYAAEPALHDYIVQAEGAFTETVRGMLNLAALNQRFEIRIVVQKHTVPVLIALAEFIVRNLPFVSQVALMGLEMTGLALPNAAEVWIDPAEYRDELREAALILHDSGILTKIYNHQLCVIDRDLWPLAVQSISDWKNDYIPTCAGCSVRSQCGGVFTTSHGRISKHLAPIGDQGGSPPLAVPRSRLGTLRKSGAVRHREI